MAESYHHHHLRAAVLERAAIVVAERGLPALTLRGLGTDLGVSHAAFRHHFGSREGVVAALAQEGFIRLETLLRDVADGEPSSRLLGMGEAYVAFALAHPGHFTAMFPTKADGFAAEAGEAGTRTFLLFRDAVTALGLPPEQRDAAVTAAWGLVHGLATLAHAGALAVAGLDTDEDLAPLIAAALRAAPIGGQPLTPRRSQS